MSDTPYLTIHINPERLRTYMKLWRDGINHEMPMAPEFKLHFIQERPTILRNFKQTASAWLMILRDASRHAEQDEVLAALVAEVQAFHDWAEAELKAFDKLELETQIEASLDDIMANDPLLAANIREMFKKLPPVSGDGSS